MKLKYLLFSFFWLFVSGVFAQKKITLEKIRVAKPVDVVMPVMMDSTNLKGEKFGTENLLGTYVNIPSQHEFTEELRADLVREYFYFQKPQKDARFQFLSFQLTADRYAKATLKIASPSMFELYINGKKELAKNSIQDSIQDAKIADKEFTTLPGTNTVVIKYLTLASNKAPEGVKVSIEPQSGDSLTNFKISYDGRSLIRIEDILERTRLESTRMSPDGRFILIGYTSITNDGKKSNYTELLDTRTNKRVNLGNKRVYWMPKTNRFYYTNQYGEELQLISVDPETFAESVIARNIPSGSFRYFPNEKELLYTEKETNDDRKGDLKLLASPEDRQQGYYDRYFIYKYDLASGAKQRLTFGRYSTLMNDMSEDSRYLLFSKNEETTEAPFRKNSMFRLDLQAMAIDTLWEKQPFVYSATYSPDASKILVLGTPQAFDGIGARTNYNETPNNYDLQAFIVDIATKKTDPVTKDFNPSVASAVWNKIDGKIYLKVTDKDCESIYRYDPQKRTFMKLDLKEDVIQYFSFSENSLMAAYWGESVSNLPKAYVVDLRNDKSVLISDPLKEKEESLLLGDVRDWNFASSDGTVIEGRYYLPPGFDPSKKYPMIVYYYGGITPTLRTFDHPYPMHVYAAQGYVVYVLQPSGTIGYGQEFSARHVNAWGKRTADDIIEGAKQFVREHSFVDDKKIGCIGASYGGFMTMYLQTQTDMFAAAVSHAGISSISSYWGEGYWGYTYSSVASAGSYPWNNRELYVDQSPLFNADKIHTPLLLLHGMDDTNVPVGESIQMYTALKILGRPVEFIQVKGENHDITNHKRRIEWNNSIYAWFAKWLKDDPAWWDSMYPPKK